MFLVYVGERISIGWLWETVFGESSARERSDRVSIYESRDTSHAE